MEAKLFQQQNVVDAYENLVVPALFRPFATDLVERARPVGPSDRVLDLGCGTGIVARTLLERLGGGNRITGLDISELMLAKARSLAPGVDFRQGNALSMPFGDGAFELVLSQAMLQFTPDKVAALREVRRVLAPGGRLVLSVWQPRNAHPLFEAVGQVADRYFGKPNDTRYSFGDSEALRRAALEAGFTDVGVESVSLPTHFRELPVRIEVTAAGYDLAGLSDDERETRVAQYEPEARRAMEPFLVDGVYVANSTANVLKAIAPIAPE